MIKITEVGLDYMINPEGVNKIPLINWKIAGDKRNIFQSSYRLQLAENSAFTSIKFDSGIIKSDNSAHIDLTSAPITLDSSRKYFIRVRITDTTGEQSEWSNPAYFITGLLGFHEWQADFITIEKKCDRDSSRGTILRKDFSIHKELAAAYAHTTALGLYKFYINGETVGHDEFTPGWTSYSNHLLYQTYDITSCLRQGYNALGVILGAGWYKGLMGFLGLRNNYGDRTAFLGQIVLCYQDGSREIICSDSSWKGQESPIIFSEIYDGEIYDARLEKTGWNQPAYRDESWRKVEKIIFSKEVLTPQAGCRVKEIDKLPAREIIVTPQGDRVLDFGQNLTGWIHFKVVGKPGDQVILNCFEVLDRDGNVYLDNLRKAKQTISYICRGEEVEEFNPHFSFQGFRYARISKYPGVPVKESFTACSIHSDMERTGDFVCSHRGVNQLHHNILWGMKGNFLDVPTDCPQRNERLGWTGDAQIFCRTAGFLMNIYPFFRKWLKDVAFDQTDEGGVPHVVPDILTGSSEDDWLVSQGTHSAAAWADVAVIAPWVLYLTYGDKRILEEQFESMHSWINFMEKHSVKNIWNYKLQFGDWVALDAEEGSYFGRTPNDLTCTAYYAYSTNLFAKIADILGKEELSCKYGDLYRKIVKTFQDTFFDKDGSMTAQTQTAHILALHFDLVPEKFRLKTVEALLDLLKKENGHLVTGFVGTPYFCFALSQNGKVDEAYDLLLKEDYPSWLFQVNKGATTIWEHWDGIKEDGSMWSPDMNSFNHYAYGAIGEWLYRVVAGLDTDEESPGYRIIKISPRIGHRLTSAGASYEGLYGLIESHWERKEKKVTLRVTIPPNSEGHILLTDAIHIPKGDGLTFSETTKGYRTITGSGTFDICYICD